MDEVTPAQEQLHFERVEDFVTGYANNVQFESSVWDLKMVFGELSRAREKVSIEQHTSMTISWPEAKMLSYYLRLQIALHELQNGKIQVPKSVWPPFPTPPPSDDPNAKAVEELIIRMREEFLTEL